MGAMGEPMPWRIRALLIASAVIGLGLAVSAYFLCTPPREAPRAFAAAVRSGDADEIARWTEPSLVIDAERKRALSEPLEWSLGVAGFTSDGTPYACEQTDGAARPITLVMVKRAGAWKVR
jgi:hypothetical protein